MLLSLAILFHLSLLAYCCHAIDMEMVVSFHEIRYFTAYLMGECIIEIIYITHCEKVQKSYSVVVWMGFSFLDPIAHLSNFVPFMQMVEFPILA